MGKKKRVILDMDGIVVDTKSVSNYPNSLLYIAIFLFHWILLFLPARIPRSYFKKHRVFVISKRPRFCKWVTSLWFKIRNYPVEEIHCIGFKGDKNLLAKRINPNIIIDDKIEKNFNFEEVNI